jgi:hypothetical protein
MPIFARRGYLLPPIKGETMPMDALGVCEDCNQAVIPGREPLASEPESRRCAVPLDSGFVVIGPRSARIR